MKPQLIPQSEVLEKPQKLMQFLNEYVVLPLQAIDGRDLVGGSVFPASTEHWRLEQILTDTDGRPTQVVLGVPTGKGRWSRWTWDLTWDEDDKMLEMRLVDPFGKVILTKSPIWEWDSFEWVLRRIDER